MNVIKSLLASLVKHHRSNIRKCFVLHRDSFAYNQCRDLTWILSQRKMSTRNWSMNHPVLDESNIVNYIKKNIKQHFLCVLFRNKESDLVHNFFTSVRWFSLRAQAGGKKKLFLRFLFCKDFCWRKKRRRQVENLHSVPLSRSKRLHHQPLSTISSADCTF